MLIKNFGSQIKMSTTLGVSEIIRELEIIKGYILIEGRILFELERRENQLFLG